MDVDIDEADVSPMQIQGPRSKDVVRDLFGDEIADLRYYWCAEAEVNGIPRRRVAHGLDRGGRLRDLPPGHVAAATSSGGSVEEAGAPFGIRAIAPSEARRIEAGIFNYGSDMRTEDTPFHVTGLERLVELEQEADFIGKDGAPRGSPRTGVDRKLVGIDIEGDPMTRRGRAERSSGPCTSPAAMRSRIGRVTAGAWSPRLERNIGYAWVPASHWPSERRSTLHVARRRPAPPTVGGAAVRRSRPRRSRSA